MSAGGAMDFGFGNIDALVNPQPNIVTRYALYGGTVDLMFDADAHKYFASVNGGELKPVMGTTDITGTLDKPALVPWGVKLCAEAIIDIMEQNSYQAGDLRQVHEVGLDQFIEWVMYAKGEHTRVSKEALDIGHDAHEWLETIQKAAIEHQMTIGMVIESGVFPLPTVKPTLEGLSPDLISKKLIVAEHQTRMLQNCCKAGVDWMIKHNFRPVKVENKVYSIEWNYGGTFDDIALVDSCDDIQCCGVVLPGGFRQKLTFKDLLVLSDWKSSKGMYNEYRFQTAAYFEAWLEEYRGNEALLQFIRDQYHVNLESLELGGRIVVKLGKEDGEFKAFFLTNEDQPKDFSAFLGLLAPYERIMEIDGLEKDEKALVKSVAKAEKAERDELERKAKIAAKELKQAERLAKKQQEELERQQKADAKAAERAERERQKAEAKAQKEADKAAKKAVKSKPKETVQ